MTPALTRRSRSIVVAAENPMRITLVISRLAVGGAERVLTIMANYWARQHQDVTLITIASQETDCYALHPAVKRIGLNLELSSKTLIAAAWHNAKRLKHLRSAIYASSPDIVISFVDRTNVLTLLATIGLGAPVIVSERSHPSQHVVGFLWNRLRNMLYRRAAAVIMQSEGLRAWARRIVKEDAVYVIPNPVEYPSHPSNRSYKARGAARTIAAMGHLTRVKGYDILLRAFEKCASKHAVWSLIVLGEGEERESLESLAGELRLKDRVSFPGVIQDSDRILQNADLFVLSSHYEGSPNALLEAMACGLPVISTDCGGGPREIIRDGINGLLVPPGDVDALASAMERLMNDESARELLGAHAVEVLGRFGLEKVMGMWDAVVYRVCHRQNCHARR